MSPDLPELNWPAYERIKWSAKLSLEYFSRPPRKFERVAVKVVAREGPVHIDVISERIAELGELPVNHRFVGKIAMGAIYEAKKSGSILDDGNEFWMLVGEHAKPRNRRHAIGKAGQADYISALEIEEGVRLVKAFSPLRSAGDWAEMTSRSFGFDEMGGPFYQRILGRISTTSS